MSYVELNKRYRSPGENRGEQLGTIALISDIHSNYQALIPVLAHIDRLEVDQVAFIGDLVDYGPEPAQCIQAMREREIIGIQGNHDAAVVGEISLEDFPIPMHASLQWTNQVLNEIDLRYLTDLPQSLRLPWGILHHGSPHDSLWHRVQNTSAATMIFRFTKESLYVVGHTHFPGAFCYNARKQVKMVPVHMRTVDTHGLATKTLVLEEGCRYIINPGSVGQPRDGDPRASFAVVSLEDTRVDSVTWYKVPYDAEITRSKILAHGLPQINGDRLLVGK